MVHVSVLRKLQIQSATTLSVATKVLLAVAVLFCLTTVDKGASAQVGQAQTLTIGIGPDTSSSPGTVTSEPAGISCPGTCSATFPYGTLVTLNATPAAGYFQPTMGSLPSGMCSGYYNCQVLIDEPQYVTVDFLTYPPPAIYQDGAIILTDPSFGTLSLGQSATYTFQTSADNYYGTTALGPNTTVYPVLLGLPEGVTAQFSSASLQLGQSFTVTLTVANSSSTYIGYSAPSLYVTDGSTPLTYSEAIESLTIAQ